jgi:hypothetical protein
MIRMESKSAHGTLLKPPISLPILRQRAKELLQKPMEESLALWSCCYVGTDGREQSDK